MEAAEPPPEPERPAETPAEAGPPPPTDPRLVDADAAFEAGDFRRAHDALAGVSPGDLDADDRAHLRRLRRGVTLDPAALVVVAVMLSIWIWLFVSQRGG